MPGPTSLSSAIHPPGPTAPRRYQVWRFSTDPIGFLESNAERYGDIFTVRLPPDDALVVVTAPPNIRAVLYERGRFAGDRADGCNEPGSAEPRPGAAGRIEKIVGPQLDRLPDGDRLDLLPVTRRLAGLLLSPQREITATALAWAGERLSRHPRVQQALAAEHEQGGEAHLEAVVAETMRSRPPVIDAVRIAVEDTELGGHRLVAGTRVAAMTCIANRRADVWADPLAFRPERLLEGGLAPDAITPLSGVLPGRAGASPASREICTVLTELLRRFRLEQARGAEERARLDGAALVPAKGGQVILRWRDRQPVTAPLHDRHWADLAFYR